ncbi:MAG: glycosyltransferase, partial [Alphaproteobacteria bacterium]
MHIAYLMTRFPNPSQTFVTDEIASHIRHGLDVTVIALQRGNGFGEMSENERIVAEHVRHAGIAGSPPARLAQLAGELAGEARRASPALKILNPLGTPFPLSRPALFSLARAWRNVAPGPDILHCHFGPVGLFGAALKHMGLTRAKLVTTFHGYDMARFSGRRGAVFYRALVEQGDLFLTVSERWRERLIGLGAPSERVRVHRVGVDVERIAFRERKPDAPVRLVSIGRLIEKKGHSVTLRALAMLRESRPDMAVTLDLIGSGPLETRLRREAAELGVADRVTFHGGLSHERVLEILERGAIFILPSLTARDGDQEGIPVVLMEAMAGGMPVISTRHSGIPELVEDGVSGLLCPENDAGAVAHALERLIDTPDRWPGMGRAGRQRVEAEFNQHTQHERLRGLYAGLL